jgi:hypothetical protein
MIDLDSIPFVQARWYYQGRRRPIRLLVVHTPEFPELFDGAERLGAYFATTDRQASVHVTVDADSMVRSVRDEDTAFGAENANADGLHAELVGYAAQSAEEWDDEYSRRVVENAASLFRAWADRWGIPTRRLTVEQIRAGEAGICGHADVYRALGGTAVRTDPGDAFPWDRFMALVTAKEDDMAKGIFIGTAGRPEVWLLVNGEKIYCPTMEYVAALAYLGQTVNGPDNIGQVSASLLDAIPVRCDTETVVRRVVDEITKRLPSGGSLTANQVSSIVNDAAAQILDAVKARRSGTLTIG